MAVGKNRAPVYNDYHYDETRNNKTFSESLRQVSGDKTFEKAKYVGLHNDIYDMISDDSRNSYVKDILYDDKTKTLTIVKKDGKKVQVSVADNFLKEAKFVSYKDEAKYTLKDGTSISMDLKGLEDKVRMKWETF